MSERASQFEIYVECGVHLANKEIRADAKGLTADADHAHDQLAALVDRMEDPDAYIVALARRLGRKRAKAIAIQPEVIALAM